VSDIFIDSWGSGTPVVLVHGSLATGLDEWKAQRPLADERFRLLVLDRRGYGRSPAVPGEDFLRDADDIIDVMGDGAMCDDLAGKIGASRVVVAGAGDQIQFTGRPLNDKLLVLWRSG